MSRNERVTAAFLFEQYGNLSGNERGAFLRLLGQQSPAELILLLISELSEVQRDRFIEMILPPAGEVVDTAPSEPDAEIQAFMDELVAKSAVNTPKFIQSVIADYKSKRERKSNPETIKRNVEICDLRKQDRRKWSLRKLAKHYDVTTRVITQVTKEEAKWRRLASDLGSE